MPVLVANDSAVLLRYKTNQDDGQVAIISFELPEAHYFGPPNDEALAGHPLMSRGLDFYGTFEVLESSSIRSLREMNKVHPFHDPSRFSMLRHFVFTFHDTTFEIVAAGVGSVKLFPQTDDMVSRVIAEQLTVFRAA